MHLEGAHERSGRAEPARIGPPADAFDVLVDRIPDLATIQRTAALALVDPPAANAAIMQSYVTLSNALGRLLHGDHDQPENATFPTFAAWAAASLRPEVMLSADKAQTAPMHLRPVRRAFHWVARDVLDVDEAISHNIAQGQGAIFEEIGNKRGKRIDARRAALTVIALIDGFWLEWCLDPKSFTAAEAEAACLAFASQTLA